MSKVLAYMMHSWTTSLPLVLSLLIALLIAILARFLPLKLPLFYSLSWGETQLASRQQLLLLPSSIVLITLFNLIISWQLHPSQMFFKRILQFCSMLVSLILTITFVKIITIFI